MRVFITGATGFIGKYLVLGLANQGHEVHALARPAASTKALEAAGIRIFPGDLLDTGSVLEAMRDCQHVYHLAGFARAWHRDRKTFHRVNVTGRSEEHTSELQSLMRISYAVFCLKKKKHTHANTYHKA